MCTKCTSALVDANARGVEEAAAVAAAVVSDSAREGNSFERRKFFLLGAHGRSIEAGEDNRDETEGKSHDALSRIVKPPQTSRRGRVQKEETREKSMRDIAAACSKCIADGLIPGTCHKCKSKERGAASNSKSNLAKRRR